MTVTSKFATEENSSYGPTVVHGADNPPVFSIIMYVPNSNTKYGMNVLIDHVNLTYQLFNVKEATGIYIICDANGNELSTSGSFVHGTQYYLRNSATSTSYQLAFTIKYNYVGVMSQVMSELLISEMNGWCAWHVFTNS